MIVKFFCKNTQMMEEVTCKEMSLSVYEDQVQQHC